MNIENEPFWPPPREYVEYMRNEAKKKELQLIEDIDGAPIGLYTTSKEIPTGESIHA